MSDYGNIIDNVVGASQSSAGAGVVSNSEANPDDAQRAFELAQSSGIPAEQIYGNLDSFERMYKNAMASQIVQQNPHLQDYANSHPLAPVISNDDWGNLDNVSRSMDKLGPHSFLGRAFDAFKQGSAPVTNLTRGYLNILGSEIQGFREGMGPGGPGSWMLEHPDQYNGIVPKELEDKSAFTQTGFAALAALGSPFELAGRLFGGLVHGYASGAKTIMGQMGMDSKIVDQAEMTLFDPGVQATLGGIPFVGPGLEAGVAGLARRLKPYMDAGVEPPRGVHPAIDHIKAEQAKIDVGNLMDALSEAQKSATKERNPELFSNFIRQHNKAEIGIPSDAVRRLYGDSVPMPDDGLLGFIPGIEEQLLGAEPAGGDIRVPIADWLAKVDPAVARELKDDIRVRRGGLTLEEAKNLEPIPEDHDVVPAEPKAEAEPVEEGQAPSWNQELQARLSATTEPEPAPKIIDTTQENVDGVRRAGGLPVEKLTLKRTDQGTGRFANVHDFDFVDDKGEQVGYIQVTDNGKDLFVENVEHNDGPQAIGARQMRDIARQLKQEFPNAETISGVRVSGAREKVLQSKISEKDWETADAGPQFSRVTVPLKADLTTESAAEFSQMIRDKSFAVGEDENGEHWIRIGPPQEAAWFKPKRIFTENERGLVQSVHALLEKIVPRMVRALPAESLQMGGGLARGLYVPFKNALPYIMWVMGAEDPHGVARHEAIHHLRQYGFFTHDEWGILKKAVTSEGWLDKFNIRERYRGAGAANQIEEAIAEGFKEWYRKNWDESLGEFRKADTPFEKVMQKIGRVYVAIKRAIKEAFGKELDFNNIFDKVETGEIGSRKGVKPLDPRQFRHPLAMNEDRPYKNVPNNLMGFGKRRPVKGFDAERYSYIQHVRITLGEDVFEDAIKGLNKKHALERAQRNWGEEAKIEPIESFSDSGLRADRPDQPELPGVTRISDRPPFERGALRGMTKTTQDKYMEFMRQRDEQDMEFARKQNEKEIARRQTDEWKAGEKRIRDQVRPDYENRPDLAADKFLREGTLYGEKVKGKPRLDSSKLTAEQKAALPKDFHSATGLHPDDVAGLFGFHSGTELVDALAHVHADRKASGLTPGRYLNSLVDTEVARQMHMQHGDLAENILSEAQDHVISQTQFDMLHEETLGAAMQAGIDTTKSSPELPFTKQHMEQFARQRFAQLRMGQVGVETHLRDGLRANELAERALLEADFREAFKQKQRQAFSFLYAREAKRLEKQRAQFEKSMKRFASREVTGVDQTYTNFIHQIMLKVGYGVRRSVQDLAYHIGRSGFSNLEEFWREKTDPASIDPREMPIADFLMDPAYKKEVDAMSVAEFRALSDTVKSMIFNGRNENTIIRAGEKADLETTRQELIDQLDTFARKQATEEGLTSGPKTGIGGLWRGGKTLVARLLQLESIFNRIDRGNPKGLFNTLFSYPAAEASNHFAALTRKYAKMYRELGKYKVDLTERIPNTLFVEPLSRESPDGESFIPMTRKGLRAVLQNVGNASNLDKLARGYSVEPDDVMSWLHRYAKKEDWDWAQAQGKIWEGIFHEASIMVENLSGLPPEKIPLEPIQTRFGTYDGWYHKILYDPNREGASKKLMGPNAEEQLNFTRATTPRSWEKSRTGYAAPIDLSLDRTPIAMGQVLRDIAFRPFIHEASKIFYDNKFRMAFTSHFGDIYKDMLIPYLRDMGSTRNVNSKLGASVDRWVEWTRQNIISTLVGLNPHTLYKHTFSAAVNSIGEVGVADFAREFKSLYAADPATGQTNWDFAMQKSEELQRRHQQWAETLGGAHEEVIEDSGGRLSKIRSVNIHIGSAPIAFFDLASAAPTFLAEYRKQIEAQSTEGEAVALGNRAVRRAHGSTAISSRPEAMRGNAVGRMLTSLYGFFNQMLQRQYEMAWRSKEMIGDFKQGEYDSGRKHLGKISTLLVTSVIAPAIIEELVTGHHGDDKEGWTERVAKAIIGEMSSSLPVVRDIAHAMINKEDPSIGLLNTPWHEVKNLSVDLSRPGLSMNRQHAGDLAKHFLTVLGMFTGLANAQEAKLLKFGIDIKSGAQRPQGPMEVYRGVVTGQSRKHK